MKKNFDYKKSLEIQKEMFDFSKTSPKSGSWWWWFLLLFFNNPKNEQKPRQLMILWSTKKDKEIECNDLKIVLDHDMELESKGKKIDGAVAAWYFDGSKMRHNFLLKQTPLLFSENGIKTENVKTEFCRTENGLANFYKTKNSFKLDIGESMKFNLSLKEKNIFTIPAFSGKKILGLNYELLRMNKLSLTGIVNGHRVKGHSYFQKVFLNGPALPWYWGIFYFKGGTILKYFKIHLGKTLVDIPVKKDINFYHKGNLYTFENMKVTKNIENDTGSW